MAKNIKFNIKLSVDGKEQLVVATTNVRELQKATQAGAQGAQTFIKSFNDAGFAVDNFAKNANTLANALNSLSQENTTFAGAMAAANTMAGKSGEDFAKLKGQVSELSKEIPIARDALAKGLYQVVSNGVPEDNWISFLEASAKASVGGIADLEEVVKVTSTVIKNYGLEWSDAAEIQDKIQLTAKNGVTSFEQMAQALPRVAANAATLGVSVDELMASFATLTGVSGNTNEVATQMAAIMNALVKPSSEAANMAKEVGIEFDAAAVKAAGGFQNFLVQLQGAVQEYSAQSGKLETEVYGRLFGSAEALRAFIPLTGELSGKFSENAAAMSGSAGTIEEAFKQMAGLSSAQLQILKNTIGAATDGMAGFIAGAKEMTNAAATIGNAVLPLSVLANTLGKVTIAQNLFRASIVKTSVAHLAFGTNATRVAAAVRVMTAATHSATAATVAMKIALKGLLVATGVGALFVGVTSALEYFATASDKAAQGAEKLTAAQAAAKAGAEKDAQGQQTVAAAAADLVAKFQALQTQWKALKTEGEKKQFINANKSAFEELGLHIDSVNSAYNTFVTNAPKVINALKSIAEAEAYKDLYKDAIKDKAANFDPTAKYAKAHAGQGRSSLKQSEIEAAGLVAGRDFARGQFDTPLTKAGAARLNAYRANKAVTAKRAEGKVYDDRVSNLGKLYTDAYGRAQQGSAYLAGGAGKVTPKGGKANTPTTITEKADTRTALQKAKDDAAFKFEDIELFSPDTIAGLKEQQSAIEGAIDNTADPRELARLAAELESVTAQLEELEKAAGRARLTPEEEAEKGQKRRQMRADILGESLPAEIPDKTQEKRDFRQKAEGDINAIKFDYDIGLIGTDEALAKIQTINDALQEMGLTPIEVPVDIKTSKYGLQQATDDIQSLGSSLTSIGQNLEVPELEAAGTIASAIGSIVQSFAAAAMVAALTTGPWGWIAFMVAGAAALATVVASISSMGGFATGGVVGGGSTFGDKKFARVNSGEMILNKFQQASLFKMIDGGAIAPAVSLPAAQGVELNVTALGSQLYTPQEQFGAVQFRLQGRDLVGSVANTTRLGGKSGKNSNIQI